MIYRKSAGFIYPSLNFQNCSIENRWIYLSLPYHDFSFFFICTGGRGGLWWRASQTEKPQAAAAVVKTLHVHVLRGVAVSALPRNVWIASGISAGRGEGSPPADYHYGNTTWSFQVHRVRVCVSVCTTSQPEKKQNKNDLLSHVLKKDKDGSHLFFFDQLVFSCGLFI